MSRKRASKVGKYLKRSHTKAVKRNRASERIFYTSPNLDFELLTQKFALPLSFTKKAEGELKVFDQKHIDHQAGQRVDLSEACVVTIDGEDAKDFDDAISLKKEKGQFVLGVHIADVSHFVSKDSHLDREALKRGNSTYLINRVVPMLPFKLSDDLCSLVQGKKRLTLSCEMVFDKKGNMKGYRFFKSLIESSRRCTYPEVEGVLNGRLNLGSRFRKLFELFLELKNVLYQKRIEGGSIDLETAEPVFRLNEAELVEEVRVTSRMESQRIIEEFMLAANRCAADFLLQHHTGVFRIHESPKEEKLEVFHRHIHLRQHQLDHQGSLDPLKKAGPNRYQLFLDSLKDPEVKALFSHLLLVSMNQARYCERNVGHYGLAFPQYTHFTSPIRRYPDLIVHRLISKLLLNKKTGYPTSALSQIAEQNSISERNSIDAEREYVKVKSVRYMRDKVGEVFDCLITGLIHRGIFLKDTRTHIEGFVDRAWLEYDSYYDERQQVYVNYKQKLKLGDKVRAELVSVNIRKLFIDFKLVD